MFSEPSGRCDYRAVGRSENPGVPVLFGGNNLPPVVEIGLNDLPKSGGASGTPRAPPGTTPLFEPNYVLPNQYSTDIETKSLFNIIS